MSYDEDTIRDLLQRIRDLERRQADFETRPYTSPVGESLMDSSGTELTDSSLFIMAQGA